MNIAIIGATGFLGSHLTRHLLNTTSHTVLAISRSGSLPAFVDPDPRLRTAAVSVLDDEQMTAALQDIDVVYYFVHLMGQSHTDFYSQEHLAAERTAAACRSAGVKRVIFMGGLGNDTDHLSQHLLSRHNTGTVLRDLLDDVIEFRASMIIGKGSLAYDIICNLVAKLPVMFLPNWASSRTQPIALADALAYLTAAATVTIPHSIIVEIGGKDVVSYTDLYRRYAKWASKPRPVFRITLIPFWLGGKWLNLFTPSYHAHVGRIMAESMSNEMIVHHPETAATYFSEIAPKGLEAAFDDTRTEVEDSTLLKK
ncbi:MAG TPA: NAD(P)H-binding protein [Candidatus Saccharimonadales bacterium]|nr:NAD(P)H-binding protein [Candidatus Saccharimonadales bacterium]